jgi:hypothetical protein
MVESRMEAVDDDELSRLKITPWLARRAALAGLGAYPVARA